MSSDNFWFIDKKNRVWMGFASDWFYESDKAHKKAWKKFVKKAKKNEKAGPSFVGNSANEAVIWASREYAEYGIWAEQDEDGEWNVV